ncbi:hypothetical protein [Parasutterella excrementihominis]|nr:hypothetical protein [Parasutterella excrementihominis]
MENPNLFTALKNISEQFPLLLLSVFIFERSRENNSETSMARGSEIDPNDGSTLMIESRRVCPIFVVAYAKRQYWFPVCLRIWSTLLIFVFYTNQLVTYCFYWSKGADQIQIQKPRF